MGKAKTINCCARLTKHPKRQKNSMNMQLHEKKNIYIGETLERKQSICLQEHDGLSRLRW